MTCAANRVLARYGVLGPPCVGAADLAIVGCKVAYEMIAECVRTTASHPHTRQTAAVVLAGVPLRELRVSIRSLIAHRSSLMSPVQGT